MLTNDLLTYLFDGSPHPLDSTMQEWIVNSRRYSEFVTTFRDKIRKKLRTTPEPDNLLDLRVELETAYLLLRERSLQVRYEPLPPRQQRAPDFAVSYTTSVTFLMEVTRLRATELTAGVESPDSAFLHERLAEAIGSKLGQFLAGEHNVLLIAVEAALLPQIDLHATMRYLQQRAEQLDPALFRRYHLRNRTEFFRQYQQLSEILVRATDGPIGAPQSWVNPQAKQLLPSKARTALHRSQSA